MRRSLFFCRKTCLVVLVFTFILVSGTGAAPPLFAQGEAGNSEDTSYRHLEASIRYWFMYGQSKYKIHGTTNNGFQIDADQEFSNMETHLAILSLAFRPFPWLTLEGGWGYGFLPGGDYKFVFNDNEPGDHDFGTMMGDPDDDYAIYYATVYFRVWPWMKGSGRHFIDAYVKWLQWSQEFEVSIQDLADDLDKVQIPGLLDWREDWRTLWIGARGECGMVKHPSLGMYQWGFIVDVAISPYIEVEGKGDYIQVPGNTLYTLIDVEGERGYGAMGELGIFYQPVRFFRVQIGGTIQYMKMRDGTAKVVDLNSLRTRTGDFENGQTINYGPYIQASFRW